MYFSKYHSGLCFIDRGMGNLEIHGEGSISASDTETWNPDESWKEQCTVLTVYDGITAICVGVLEQFPNMVKLRLPKSVTRIDMTDELNMLLHTNDVLVHAAYTVFAVVYVKNNDGWYDFHTADNETEFNEKIEAIKHRALYDTGITPQYGQQLLTLSTCYGATKSDRIMVIGVESPVE